MPTDIVSFVEVMTYRYVLSTASPYSFYSLRPYCFHHDRGQAAKKSRGCRVTEQGLCVDNALE